MFGLGAPELLVILLIVLVLFGSRRLPELGRALGRSIREFKQASGKDKDEISTWLRTEDEKDKTSAETAKSEPKKGFPQGEVDRIPGVKEAREIKETADKIKGASRLFFKK